MILNKIIVPQILTIEALKLLVRLRSGMAEKVLANCFFVPKRLLALT